MTFDVNELDDLSGLRDEFSRYNRIQLRRFLDIKTAKSLQAAVEGLEWCLVLNEKDKHFDIHPEQIKLLGREKLGLIKKGVKARAEHEFQYMFENYPVFDILQSGKQINPLIQSIFEHLNSLEFLQKIKTLTGETVDFCDMQATRYRAGHFLTAHDDNIEGKNRKLAYVLYLSQRWRDSWGGQLEFLAPDGTVTDAFSPHFNSLSLFKIPSEHQVSPVKPKAEAARVALTGWFRTRA